MKTEDRGQTPARIFIKRPGGKSRLVKQLLPLIPQHVCYCEPFGGGAAVLLAKQKSPIEVYNDIDGELANVFRQLKYHPRALEHEFDWVINSREDFHESRKQPGLTELQRAARWIIRNTLSFGGDSHSFGVHKASGGGAASRLSGKLLNLRAAHQRLDGVIIENLPYERAATRTRRFLDSNAGRFTSALRALFRMENTAAFTR